MITVPNRTDMSDESLALRTIDENLRKLADEVLMEIMNVSKEPSKKKETSESKVNKEAPRVHIAYASSGDGTVGFSTTDSTGRTYIGIYTDFKDVASADPKAYKWTKVKGDNGVSVSSYTRWYYLAVETPEKPALKVPPSPWTITEPNYIEGSTNNLYYVDQSVFSDGSFYYSDVQVSSSYAAAKNAFIKTLENHQKTLKQLEDLSRQTKKEIADAADSISRKIKTEYYSSADMDDKIANIESQITQTDNAVNVKFSEALKNINDLKFDSDKKYSEIISTIRLDKNGISIGKSGNRISMNLDNDKLRFMQEGIEVAYMSDNKLYIQNAEVLSSIKLGKFAFVPDTETGSLSFGKVED